MRIEKYWNELLQIITEDENARVRKSDIVALKETDIVEFMCNLKFFEKRVEEKLANLNKMKYAQS